VGAVDHGDRYDGVTALCRKGGQAAGGLVMRQ
jgi:hypothetical protein